LFEFTVGTFLYERTKNTAMYDIVIGRDEDEKKKYGLKGTVLIGKQYVRMGQSVSLANNIYLDIARSHVFFVCGKRGSGKSYTLGSIAEGLADIDPQIAQNISLIILDTMGIYWTMKYPNKKDEDLLRSWNLEPKSLPVKIYTPVGYYTQFKEKGIPTDAPFAIKPTELSATDWCMAFSVEPYSAVGTLISRVIYELQTAGTSYSLDDIIQAISRTSFDSVTQSAAQNLFFTAQNWGLFDSQATPLAELARGGQVTILDISCYATSPGGWSIKQLATAIVAQKLFIQRMISRKNEEYAEVHSTMNYFSETATQKREEPLVWLIIDEAHEFLPKDTTVASSEPLITILREGRQPGISLILATQQPGKIHTDVLTQADTVFAHRITAKLDTDALAMLSQSYMRAGIISEMDTLPRVKGAGVIFDDTNEKLFSMRIRPRFTWHGGSSPVAIPSEKKYFT
jgi:uncharacterized protein